MILIFSLLVSFVIYNIQRAQQIGYFCRGSKRNSKYALEQQPPKSPVQSSNKSQDEHSRLGTLFIFSKDLAFLVDEVKLQFKTSKELSPKLLKTHVVKKTAKKKVSNPYENLGLMCNETEPIALMAPKVGLLESSHCNQSSV